VNQRVEYSLMSGVWSFPAEDRRARAQQISLFSVIKTLADRCLATEIVRVTHQGRSVNVDAFDGWR